MQVYLKVNTGIIMQKALAQNPNLLRTLWGFPSLLFSCLLTQCMALQYRRPYLYTTDTETTVNENVEPVKLYDDDTNETNWRWTFTADGDNLLGSM